MNKHEISMKVILSKFDGWIHSKFRPYFYQHGLNCAKHPIRNISISIIIFVCCCFHVAKDPIAVDHPRIHNFDLEHLNNIDATKWRERENESTSTNSPSTNFFIGTPFSYIHRIYFRYFFLEDIDEELMTVMRLMDRMNKKINSMDLNCWTYESLKGNTNNFTSKIAQISKRNYLVNEFRERWWKGNKSECLTISLNLFDEKNSNEMNQLKKDIRNSERTENIFIQFKRYFIERSPDRLTMNDMIFGGKNMFVHSNTDHLTFSVSILLNRYNHEQIKLLHEEIGELLLNEFEIVDGYEKGKNSNEGNVNKIEKFLLNNQFYSIDYIWLGYERYISLSITYAILLVYIYASVYNMPHVKSKWGLALAAVVTVIATPVICLALISFIAGNEYISTDYQDIFPYLVMLVGLENIVLLTHSIIAHTPVHWKAINRVPLGLGRECVRITKNVVLVLFISLTISVIWPIREIRQFAVFICVGVIVDLFLQLFFFLTCIAIDIQRVTLEEQLFTLNQKNHLMNNEEKKDETLNGSSYVDYLNKKKRSIINLFHQIRNINNDNRIILNKNHETKIVKKSIKFYCSRHHELMEVKKNNDSFSISFILFVIWRWIKRECLSIRGIVIISIISAFVIGPLFTSFLQNIIDHHNQFHNNESNRQTDRSDEKQLNYFENINNFLSVHKFTLEEANEHLVKQSHVYWPMIFESTFQHLYQRYITFTPLLNVYNIYEKKRLEDESMEKIRLIQLNEKSLRNEIRIFRQILQMTNNLFILLLICFLVVVAYIIYSRRKDSNLINVSLKHKLDELMKLEDERLSINHISPNHSPHTMQLITNLSISQLSQISATSNTSNNSSITKHHQASTQLATSMTLMSSSSDSIPAKMAEEVKRRRVRSKEKLRELLCGYYDIPIRDTSSSFIILLLAQKTSKNGEWKESLIEVLWSPMSSAMELVKNKNFQIYSNTNNLENQTMNPNDDDDEDDDISDMDVYIMKKSATSINSNDMEKLSLRSNYRRMRNITRFPIHNSRNDIVLEGVAYENDSLSESSDNKKHYQLLLLIGNTRSSTLNYYEITMTINYNKRSIFIKQKTANYNLSTICLSNNNNICPISSSSSNLSISSSGSSSHSIGKTEASIDKMVLHLSNFQPNISRLNSDVELQSTLLCIYRRSGEINLILLATTKNCADVTTSMTESNNHENVHLFCHVFSFDPFSISRQLDLEMNEKIHRMNCVNLSLIRLKRNDENYQLIIHTKDMSRSLISINFNLNELIEFKTNLEEWRHTSKKNDRDYFLKRSQLIQRKNNFYQSIGLLWNEEYLKKYGAIEWMKISKRFNLLLVGNMRNGGTIVTFVLSNDDKYKPINFFRNYFTYYDMSDFRLYSPSNNKCENIVELLITFKRRTFLQTLNTVRYFEPENKVIKSKNLFRRSYKQVKSKNSSNVTSLCQEGTSQLYRLIKSDKEVKRLRRSEFNRNRKGNIHLLRSAYLNSIRLNDNYLLELHKSFERNRFNTDEMLDIDSSILFGIWTLSSKQMTNWNDKKNRTDFTSEDISALPTKLFSFEFMQDQLSDNIECYSKCIIDNVHRIDMNMTMSDDDKIMKNRFLIESITMSDSGQHRFLSPQLTENLIKKFKKTKENGTRKYQQNFNNNNNNKINNDQYLIRGYVSNWLSCLNDRFIPFNKKSTNNSVHLLHRNGYFDNEFSDDDLFSNDDDNCSSIASLCDISDLFTTEDELINHHDGNSTMKRKEKKNIIRIDRKSINLSLPPIYFHVVGDCIQMFIPHEFIGNLKHTKQCLIGLSLTLSLKECENENFNLTTLSIPYVAEKRLNVMFDTRLSIADDVDPIEINHHHHHHHSSPQQQQQLYYMQFIDTLRRVVVKFKLNKNNFI
ncbi:hypothetical protein SNEBB_000211 [Seison nebaliae]|nr:hypothetical protein SNEBB_000211 [Seison nebaliae]